MTQTPPALPVVQQAVAMSPAEMMAELTRLKAENAEIKKKNEKPISFKVSQKEALSIYGLQRFPVTLYRNQWERLLAKKEDILGFIQENVKTLKTK